MCILKLSKALMYEFHYDCIKNKHGNNSRLLKLKPKMSIKILTMIKKLTLATIQLSQNIMIIQTN